MMCSTRVLSTSVTNPDLTYSVRRESKLSFCGSACVERNVALKLVILIWIRAIIEYSCQNSCQHSCQNRSLPEYPFIKISVRRWCRPSEQVAHGWKVVDFVFQSRKGLPDTSFVALSITSVHLILVIWNLKYITYILVPVLTTRANTRANKAPTNLFAFSCCWFSLVSSLPFCPFCIVRSLQVCTNYTEGSCPQEWQNTPGTLGQSLTWWSHDTHRFRYTYKYKFVPKDRNLCQHSCQLSFLCCTAYLRHHKSSSRGTARKYATPWVRSGVPTNCNRVCSSSVKWVKFSPKIWS